MLHRGPRFRGDDGVCLLGNGWRVAVWRLSLAVMTGLACFVGGIEIVGFLSRRLGAGCIPVAYADREYLSQISRGCF